MKTAFLTLAAMAAVLGFTGCADDDEHHHHSHASTSTTTTEETVVREPVSHTTTETQIQRY